MGVWTYGIINLQDKLLLDSLDLIQAEVIVVMWCSGAKLQSDK